VSVFSVLTIFTRSLACLQDVADGVPQKRKHSGAPEYVGKRAKSDEPEEPIHIPAKVRGTCLPNSTFRRFDSTTAGKSFRVVIGPVVCHAGSCGGDFGSRHSS
jgi:hypothetical protein